MYCSKCGAEILDDSNFCVACGTKVEQNFQKKVGDVSESFDSDVSGTKHQIEDNTKDLSAERPITMVNVDNDSSFQKLKEMQKGMNQSSPKRKKESNISGAQVVAVLTGIIVIVAFMFVYRHAYFGLNTDLENIMGWKIGMVKLFNNVSVDEDYTELYYINGHPIAKNDQNKVIGISIKEEDRYNICGVSVGDSVGLVESELARHGYTRLSTDLY